MIIPPHWCVHFYISVLVSIQNWILGPFWIFIIVRDSNCWAYDPTALALTVGQFVVMILVITLFFTISSIYEQWPRFLNSWPIAIALHDTPSTAIIAVRSSNSLYPVLILLVLNHQSILLHIFSFMAISLQLLLTSAIPKIAIHSLIKIFFKVSNLCCISWYDTFPIPPMFWNMILILPFLFPPLSCWPNHLDDSYWDF